MKRIFKSICIVLAIAVIIEIYVPLPGKVDYVLAHSGRTDSTGGHKDNQNKSGLGNYHYHCDGNPAHLHDGGSCPYGNGGSQASVVSPPAADLQPETVKIADAPVEMFMGNSQAFTYTVENGTSSNVTVQSSNPDIISVNSDNTLKAVGVGESTIKVISANTAADFTVAVKAVEIESLSVEKKDMELTIIKMGNRHGISRYKHTCEIGRYTWGHNQ